MCRNGRLINLAVEIARSSSNTKHKHAALLVKGGRVLSVGQNTEIPVIANHFKTRHAEEDVFRKTTLTETPCNLYVARVTSGEGRATDSLPCRACMSFLLSTRVRVVFYTDKQGGFHSINLNTLRNRLVKQGGTSLTARPVRRVANSKD